MDWNSTMQVILWVGRQSKMKKLNSEITETRRRKGKKNEGFRVKKIGRASCRERVSSPV